MICVAIVFSRGSDVRPGAGRCWPGLLGLRGCAAVICVAFVSVLLRFAWNGPYFGVFQGVGCTPWCCPVDDFCSSTCTYVILQLHIASPFTHTPTY